MNTATTEAPVFCPAPRHFKVVVKKLKLPAPVITLPPPPSSPKK
jgi:hypothetical protein